MNLGERIVAPVPGRLDMHGGYDVLARGVAPVVVNEIASPDRGQIAERRYLASGWAQPRMPIHAEVPKMMMGVDNWSAIRPAHPKAPVRSGAAPIGGESKVEPQPGRRVHRALIRDRDDVTGIPSQISRTAARLSPAAS
jgi:hypothetical protein